MNDLPHAAWRKSSLSVHNGACVEVAMLPRGAALRDSKRPGGPVLAVSYPAFGRLVADARSGALNAPA